MKTQTKLRSRTRQRGEILSGEPPGLVCGSACEPRGVANVDPRIPEYPNKSICVTRDLIVQRLGIIQINLHKAKAATTLLSQTMQTNKDLTHIALITEPHTHGNRIPNIDMQGFNVVTPGSIEAPRTCILINNRINYMQISPLNSRDTVAIMVDTSIATGKKQTIFASVYQPPQYDNQPPTLELRRVIKYAKDQDTPLIIGCDTNGHHQMWGSKNSNTRGRNLAEYLTTADLSTANIGNTPTFKSANGETIIDVTITTRTIANRIKEWKVLEEESLSDHRYISFQVTSKTETLPSMRNPKRTNWTKFRTNIRNTIPKTNTYATSTTEIEEEVTQLNQTIQNAFRKATPTPKPKQNKKQNSPWWTKELAALRTQTNKAHRDHARTHIAEDWHKWRELKHKYASTIQREKRRGWRKYTTGIDTLQDAQKLTKVLDKGQSQKMSLLIRPDGTITKTTEETLQHLMDTHFPGNTTIDPTEGTASNHTTTNREWIEAMNTITPKKVVWAVKEFKPYKSPGPDGIYPIMLQKSIDILGPNICNILRACMAYGYVPIAWRDSKVIFIPKPGKDRYDNAKSYRPISLTSFMMKTLEKIIDRDLRDSTLKKAPIHKNQHAYQTGKSTETALHQLTSKIELAIDQKQYALGAFFDIAGAFDNAPSKVIIKALQDRKAKSTTIKWISTLLTTRKVTTKNGTSEITVKATKGCPQGGVLSPLLWCLIVDELITKLNKEDIYTQAYSDDGTILISGYNLRDVCIKVQRGLTIAIEWCKENGLTIHPAKTEVVLFTRKKKMEGWIDLKIENKGLTLKNEVKYLGVTLDKKLAYNTHVNDKCAKAIKTLYQAKNAISHTWGMSPKITKWLYTAVIKPMLSYAAIIWWERATYLTTQRKLASTQRLATLSITGGMKTTPNIALNSMSGLLPLHLHIMSEAMRSHLRMKANGTWKTGTYEGHRAIEQHTECITGINAGDSDLTLTGYNFEQLFTTENEPSYQAEPDAGTLTCHTYCKPGTDGSLISIATCQGIEYKEIYDRGHHTSSVLGELQSTIDLCNEIINTHPQHGITQIKISCMNPGTIKALESVKTNSETTRDCKDILNRLTHHLPVCISLRNRDRMIPDLNTNGQTEITERNTKPTHNALTLRIREWAKEQHTREFIAYNGANQTKDRMVNPYWSKLKNMHKRKREDIRILTQILSGHAWLNKHLHRMKLIQTPLCPLCEGDEEDVKHHIYECNELAEIRTNVFGGPITPQSMPIREMKFRDIISFCKGAKRLHFEPNEI